MTKLSFSDISGRRDEAVFWHVQQDVGIMPTRMLKMYNWLPQMTCMEMHLPYKSLMFNSGKFLRFSWFTNLYFLVLIVRFIPLYHTYPSFPYKKTRITSLMKAEGFSNLVQTGVNKRILVRKGGSAHTPQFLFRNPFYFDKTQSNSESIFSIIGHKWVGCLSTFS